MYPGPKLYGGGMRCGWSGLGRGWSPRSEQAIVCIAKAPLGLSLRGSSHYAPAPGEGESEEGGYGQQGCVIYHFIIPEEMGVGRHSRSVWEPEPWGNLTHFPGRRPGDPVPKIGGPVTRARPSGRRAFEGQYHHPHRVGSSVPVGPCVPVRPSPEFGPYIH